MTVILFGRSAGARRGALAAAALLVLGADPLSGQRSTHRAVDDSPAFDYFVSRYVAVSETDRSASDGVGGRLMWPLGAVAGSEVPGAARAAIGAFLVHAPDRDGRQQMWWYGAQADLRMTEARLAQRVDPFVTLGLGATRSDVHIASGAPVEISALAPRPISHTRLSVAPGLGLRFHLAPGFGIRGDARQIFDLSDSGRRNVELSAGLSLGT